MKLVYTIQFYWFTKIFPIELLSPAMKKIYDQLTATVEEKDTSEMSSARDTGGRYVPSGIDTGKI